MFIILAIYIIGFILTFMYMVTHNSSLREILLFCFGWPILLLFMLLLSCWFALTESWRW